MPLGKGGREGEREREPACDERGKTHPNIHVQCSFAKEVRLDFFGG